MSIETQGQQEPFRGRIDRLGLIVYAAAVVVGGPLVVVAKRAGPDAEGPLRVGLALAALVGVALLARRAGGAARALLGLAALAALLRALVAGGALTLPRLAGALVEGAEMALVALALAIAAPARDRRTRGALVALAIGALGLKVAWGLQQLLIVRYGGLALLPLAVVGLVGLWRGARRGAPTR